MLFAALALLLVLSQSGKRSGSGSPSTGVMYTDQKGVVWRIWQEMPNFWSIATQGYGKKFTHVQGFVSMAQAKQIIEGNAAGRDPVTGNLTPAASAALATVGYRMPYRYAYPPTIGFRRAA